MQERTTSPKEEFQDRMLDLEQAFTALVETAKQVACENAQGFCDQAAAECKQAGSQIAEFESSLRRLIADNPVRSILAAAGVGCVLGILLRRR